MNTVWALMQFLCSPVMGALSDRFGRRPVVLCSNFGLGLDYILMAPAPTLGCKRPTSASILPREPRVAGARVPNHLFGLGQARAAREIVRSAEPTGRGTPFRSFGLHDL